ncbi:MAG: outer membrane beta-barrel protein [Porphyromonas sp.]|nr:outer membrane beta-barrel protein [Porphyromonas sp.]
MEDKQHIKPKDSWEDALRDKLDGYQLPLEQLPPLVLPKRSNRRRIIAVWATVVSSAAAAVAAFLLLTRTGTAPSPTDSPQPVLLADKYDEVIVPDTLHLLTQNNLPARTRRETVEHTSLTTVTGAGGDNDPAPSSEETEVTPDREEDRKEAREPAETDKATDREATTVIPTTPRPESKTESKTILRSRKHRKGATLSLNIGGLTNNNQMSETDPTYAPFAMLGVSDHRTYGRPEEKQYFTQERPPIELGASVLLPLSDRWSIETGLHYSLRQLEVTTDGLLGQDRLSLKVHSIGVPIAVHYTVINRSQWQAYLSSGLSAKLPVHTAHNGTMDDQLRPSFYVDANLSAGVQYKITDTVGFYGAVGGSYDVKPMNRQLYNSPKSRMHLELKAGLRLHFNNHQ